ncbi:hypothetical protein HN51_054171 [Arachis hypogaea]
MNREAIRASPMLKEQITRVYASNLENEVDRRGDSEGGSQGPVGRGRNNNQNLQRCQAMRSGDEGRRLGLRNYGTVNGSTHRQHQVDGDQECFPRSEAESEVIPADLIREKLRISSHGQDGGVARGDEGNTVRNPNDDGG